jgi:hypothetical protein
MRAARIVMAMAAVVLVVGLVADSWIVMALGDGPPQETLGAAADARTWQLATALLFVIRVLGGLAAVFLFATADRLGRGRRPRTEVFVRTPDGDEHLPWASPAPAALAGARWLSIVELAAVVALIVALRFAYGCVVGGASPAILVVAAAGGVAGTWLAPRADEAAGADDHADAAAPGAAG